jgi:hypothetical protein
MPHISDRPGAAVVSQDYVGQSRKPEEGEAFLRAVES